jgi:AcrR family transcriptional regulator
MAPKPIRATENEPKLKRGVWKLGLTVINGTVQCRIVEFKSRLSPEREGEILAIAIELVGEVGFERASVDAIAALAGTSKSTLYRRWSTKSELIVEAVRRRTGVSFSFADQGSFRADVLCALHLFTDWLVRDGAILRALVDAGRRDPLLQAEIDRQLAQPNEAMWEDFVIDRARERGELRSDVDLSWFNELCQAVLLARLLLLDVPVSDAYLQRLTDEVVLPMFARPNTGKPASRRRSTR